MARTFLTRRRLLVGAAAGAGAFALGYAGVRHWRGGAPPLLNAARHNPPPVAGAGARLPRFVSHPDGGCVLSWVEPVNGGHALRCAYLDAQGWRAATEVARGTHWFINWIDFPSVVPIDRDFWLAHWLERSAGGGKYDYDIVLALSNDGGRAWRRAGRPHASDVPAEYGFVSIFADGDAAGIVWLDGRDYVKSSERHLHPEKSGRFALRYTQVAREGHIQPDRVLDGNVCTCCQTAAASAEGVPLIAYRARTDAEVRDIKLVRRVAGAWTAPADLGAEGWTIAACPTNGPALAARGKRVVAAWFTAADDRPRVRAAISADGGAAWGEAVDLDARLPLGRVGAAWLDEDRVAVSWLGAPQQQRAPLFVALLDGQGRELARGTIAQVPASRDSGIPQITAYRGRLLAAWTESGPQFGVRVTEVAVRI